MQDNHTRQPIPVEQCDGDSTSTEHTVDTSIYGDTSNPRGYARTKETDEPAIPLSRS